MKTKLRHLVASCAAAALAASASAQPLSGNFRWQVSRNGQSWSSALTLDPGDSYQIRGLVSWVDGPNPSAAFAGCTFEQIDLIGANASDVFGGASSGGGAGSVPTYIRRQQGVTESWSLQAGTGASALGLKIDNANPVNRTNFGQLPKVLAGGIPNPFFFTDNPFTVFQMTAIAGDPKTLTISSTWTRLGTPASNEFKVYTTETGTNKKPTQEATRTDAVVTIIPAPASGALGLLLLATSSSRRRKRTRHPATRALAAGVAASILTSSASAQCEPGWIPNDYIAGVEGGLDTVYATCTWDPDGPGPEPERLVIGGSFEIAGDIIAHNIAMWDGQTWSTLGPPGFLNTVDALTVYRGELIVGTDNSSSGQGYLFRWNGTNWAPLGIDASVHALAVYNDELIVGGSFLRAGGLPANRIASWNGSTWSDLAGGVGGPVSSTNLVQALLVRDGLLLVGGGFTTAGSLTARGVASWDGSAWSPIGDGPGDVYSLGIYKDELYAGGRFASDKGTNLSRWDGTSWRPVPGAPSGGSSFATVFSLQEYSGRLIAGGLFALASGLHTPGIAAWDGASWTDVDGGVGGLSGTPIAHVRTMTIFQHHLFAGGRFLTAGFAPASNIAFWNTSEWTSLGDPSLDFEVNEYDVRALAVYHGSLYAGRKSFSGSTIDGIRSWNGAEWATPSGGIPRDVLALTIYQDRLIAGGSFVSAGGITANSIAAWDDTRWSALSAPTPGINGVVWALADYQGELIAAGKFTNAGGEPASNIAAWNGSRWRPLGAGTNNTIRALAVYDGELIAGGDFTSAGPPGSAAYHIARWDGSAWLPIADGGFSKPVYALLVHEGELLIGGGFTDSFTQSLAYLARWRGADWIPFPAPLEGTCDTPSFCDSGVRALAIYNGQLIAAGRIIVPGAEDLDAIVAWNGSSWSTLGATTRGGSNNTVNALAVYGPELIAAGAFYAVDGRAHYGWARYSAHACPADLTCDDVADFADYLEFLNLYDAQDPRADFTHDGIVDFADYLEFLNLFDAGC